MVRRIPPGAALEDVEQARKLLAAERRELERALDHRGREDDCENAGFQEPANLATELYLDELDESVADDLRDRLAALKRAEQRLAGGPTASRSRAVGRSRTSASRYSRPLSGQSRKSARWTSAAPADRLCEVLASEHADENAVGVGDYIRASS